MPFRLELFSFFYFSFFIFYNVGFGQPIDYIDHIGSEDGLTSQLCYRVIEDKSGNLWISSFQDIEKYDGYSITSFPIKNANNQGYGILNIAVDERNNIWIFLGEVAYNIHENHTTISYSKFDINIIDPLTENILKFEDYVDNNQLELKEIKRIQTFNSKIYFLTHQNKIFSYKDSLKLLTEPKGIDGYMMLTEQEEILDISTESIEIKNINGLTIDQIDNAAISKYSAFSITSLGEIVFLKEKNDSISFIQYESGSLSNIIAIPSSELRSIEINQILLTQYSDGLLLINDQLYNCSNPSVPKINSLVDGRGILNYLITANEMLYIATDLGIYIFDNKTKLFTTIGKGEARQNSVRGIFVNDEISAFNNNHTEVILNNHGEFDLSFLDSYDLGTVASMHYMDPLKTDVLWSCGRINGRLRKIDFNNKRIKDDYRLPKAGIFNNILRSSQSNLLYLAGDKGFFKLLESQDLVLKINLDCSANQDFSANHIVERENEMLIATSIGVISYDETTEQCTINPIFSDSLNYEIQFIHLDNNNPEIVWLGTKRGGVIQWNSISNLYTIYNVDNGLSNNDVHAIIEDSHNQLWISTNKYLNCLNKESKKISVFTEKHGISNSEFNRWSYHFDSLSNTIYFGGLNGYTYFNPDSINISEISNNIKVRLLEVSKTNTEGIENSMLSQVSNDRALELLEEDISFSVELSTNNLSNTDEISYSYRIPGIYNEWKTQAHNVINLSKLPYGDYTIEFISDLEKPFYTSDVLSFQIEVIQPFRKTWTAFILAFLGIMLLTWYLIQRYTQNIKERNTKLEQTIDLRTKELTELNNFKSKIFAILAHDLRNPISSLMDISDKIRFLAKNNRLDEIDDFTDQSKGKINALNDNLDNILLWAVSEQNMLVQQAEQLSLKSEIVKILDIYSHNISLRNISAHIEFEDDVYVYADVKILQAILRNLISNAIKFSYNDGIIHFVISKDSDQRVELLIVDNGIGMQDNLAISKPEMTSIIRNEGKGSGIGLQLVKELSEKAGIQLTIETHSKNIGTTVRLDIPKI